MELSPNTKAALKKSIKNSSSLKDVLASLDSLISSNSGGGGGGETPSTQPLPPTTPPPPPPTECFPTPSPSTTSLRRKAAARRSKRLSSFKNNSRDNKHQTIWYDTKLSSSLPTLSYDPDEEMIDGGQGHQLTQPSASPILKKRTQKSRYRKKRVGYQTMVARLSSSSPSLSYDFDEGIKQGKSPSVTQPPLLASESSSPSSTFKKTTINKLNNKSKREEYMMFEKLSASSPSLTYYPEKGAAIIMSVQRGLLDDNTLPNKISKNLRTKPSNHNKTVTRKSTSISKKNRDHDPKQLFEKLSSSSPSLSYWPDDKESSALSTEKKPTTSDRTRRNRTATTKEGMKKSSSLPSLVDHLGSNSNTQVLDLRHHEPESPIRMKVKSESSRGLLARANSLSSMVSFDRDNKSTLSDSVASINSAFSGSSIDNKPPKFPKQFLRKKVKSKALMYAQLADDTSLDSTESANANSKKSILKKSSSADSLDGVGSFHHINTVDSHGRRIQKSISMKDSVDAGGSSHSINDSRGRRNETWAVKSSSINSDSQRTKKSTRITKSSSTNSLNGGGDDCNANSCYSVKSNDSCVRRRSHRHNSRKNNKESIQKALSIGSLDVCGRGNKTNIAPHTIKSHTRKRALPVALHDSVQTNAAGEKRQDESSAPVSTKKTALSSKMRSMLLSSLSSPSPSSLNSNVRNISAGQDQVKRDKFQWPSLPSSKSFDATDGNVAEQKQQGSKKGSALMLGKLHRSSSLSMTVGAGKMNGSNSALLRTSPSKLLRRKVNTNKVTGEGAERPKLMASSSLTSLMRFLASSSESKIKVSSTNAKHAQSSSMSLDGASNAMMITRQHQGFTAPQKSTRLKANSCKNNSDRELKKPSPTLAFDCKNATMSALAANKFNIKENADMEEKRQSTMKRPDGIRKSSSSSSLVENSDKSAPPLIEIQPRPLQLSSKKVLLELSSVVSSITEQEYLDSEKASTSASSSVLKKSNNNQNSKSKYKISTSDSDKKPPHNVSRKANKKEEADMLMKEVVDMEAALNEDEQRFRDAREKARELVLENVTKLNPNAAAPTASNASSNDETVNKEELHQGAANDHPRDASTGLEVEETELKLVASSIARTNDKQAESENIEVTEQTRLPQKVEKHEVAFEDEEARPQNAKGVPKPKDTIDGSYAVRQEAQCAENNATESSKRKIERIEEDKAFVNQSEQQDVEREYFRLVQLEEERAKKETIGGPATKKDQMDDKVFGSSRRSYKPITLDNVMAKPFNIDVATWEAPSWKKTTKEKALIENTAKYLLADTATKTKAMMIKAFELVDYDEGRTIMQQGEVGDHLYIVRNGTVAFQINDVTVGTGGTGTTFGDQNLMFSSAATVSVVAKEASKVFRLHQETYRAILQQDHLAKEEHQARPSPLRASEMWWTDSKHAQRQNAIQDSLENIEKEDFERIRILGDGQFGKVWLVSAELDIHCDSPQRLEFALKLQSTHDDMRKSWAAKAIKREIKAMEDLSDHPFGATLYKTYETEESIDMLIGILPGGELWDVIHKEDKATGDWYSGIPERDARFYSMVIADTLGYFHSRKYVYRDLKPDNVMIDRYGYPVIIDFGFCIRLKQDAHTDKTFTFCGTPNYVAPELVKNRGHNAAADCWALGVVIYEMLSGENPFYHDEMKRKALFRAICKEKPRALDKTATTKNVRGLIRKLLVKDPRERIRMQGVLEHPWFRGLSLKKLRARKIKAPWVPISETASMETATKNAPAEENHLHENDFKSKKSNEERQNGHRSLQGGEHSQPSEKEQIKATSKAILRSRVRMEMPPEHEIQSDLPVVTEDVPANADSGNDCNGETLKDTVCSGKSRDSSDQELSLDQFSIDQSHEEQNVGGVCRDSMKETADDPATTDTPTRDNIAGEYKKTRKGGITHDEFQKDDAHEAEKMGLNKLGDETEKMFKEAPIEAPDTIKINDDACKEPNHAVFNRQETIANEVLADYTLALAGETEDIIEIEECLEVIDDDDDDDDVSGASAFTNDYWACSSRDVDQNDNSIIVQADSFDLFLPPEDDISSLNVDDLSHIEEEIVPVFEVPNLPVLDAWQKKTKEEKILGSEVREIRTPRSVMIAIVEAANRECVSCEVPKSHKNQFESVATAAASIGRLTRLGEHAIEAEGNGSVPDEIKQKVDNWKPTGAPLRPSRSLNDVIAIEAAAMGSMSRLKEECVTSNAKWGEYDLGMRHEDKEKEIAIDDMLDTKGRRTLRSDVLVDRYVQDLRNDNVSRGFAERAMGEFAWVTKGVTVENVPLPTPKPPKFTPKSTNLSSQEISDALARGVAESVWDRKYRLNRPKAGLRITKTCPCKYCELPNPYQTHAYKRMTTLVATAEKNILSVPHQRSVPDDPFPQTTEAPIPVTSICHETTKVKCAMSQISQESTELESTAGQESSTSQTSTGQESLKSKVSAGQGSTMTASPLGQESAMSVPSLGQESASKVSLGQETAISESSLAAQDSSRSLCESSSTGQSQSSKSKKWKDRLAKKRKAKETTTKTPLIPPS